MTIASQIKKIDGMYGKSLNSLLSCVSDVENLLNTTGIQVKSIVKTDGQITFLVDSYSRKINRYTLRGKIQYLSMSSGKSGIQIFRKNSPIILQVEECYPDGVELYLDNSDTATKLFNAVRNLEKEFGNFLEVLSNAIAELEKLQISEFLNHALKYLHMTVKEKLVKPITMKDPSFRLYRNFYLTVFLKKQADKKLYYPSVSTLEEEFKKIAERLSSEYVTITINSLTAASIALSEEGIKTLHKHLQI